MTREFDPCGELPTGVTVLEASAGTGKTYTIASLAARYIGEGIPIDQLLLVTFTRRLPPSCASACARGWCRWSGSSPVATPARTRSCASSPRRPSRRRAARRGGRELRRRDDRHHPRVLRRGARRPRDRRRRRPPDDARRGPATWSTRSSRTSTRASAPNDDRAAAAPAIAREMAIAPRSAPRPRRSTRPTATPPCSPNAQRVRPAASARRSRAHLRRPAHLACRTR